MVEATTRGGAPARSESGSTLPWRREAQFAYRLLLVDPGRTPHSLLEPIASSVGIAVHRARSAADVLRHGRKFSYDVLLVDAALAGATLLSLSSQLRTIRQNAALLISGELRHVPEALNLEGHLLGSLRKPWDPEELETWLLRAIALSRARRAQPAVAAASPARARTRGGRAGCCSVGRLLLVAKSDDARRVTRLLRGHLPSDALVHAESLSRALALCGEQTFDVVLADTSLSDACGLDAIVKMRRAAPQAATVALTSTDDRAFSDQALLAGAQDVLLKGGLSAQALVRCIEHARSRQRAQERLQHGALHDDLTGLAKRTLFNHRLALALARSRRLGQRFAVIYIDLDHFKRINDDHGHDTGDAVLMAVSQRFQSAVREYDTVARLGGDEFAILLEALDDMAEARTVTRRVLDALAPAVRSNGRELAITASMGVSVFPEAGDTPEQLLKSADQAMYSAKRAGRNVFALAPAALNELGAAPPSETNARRDA